MSLRYCATNISRVSLSLLSFSLFLSLLSLSLSLSIYLSYGSIYSFSSSSIHQTIYLLLSCFFSLCHQTSLFSLSLNTILSLRRAYFLHRYSGSMPLSSLASISAGYLFVTVFIVYAQGTVASSLDLKPAGIILFIVGISGNLYHHYHLSKLRQGRERGYKIPTGGLFGLVTCPHYLFEILTFAGIACASQTVYSFSVIAGTTFYLMGRSWATRNCYNSKFPDYPREIKALVPFIF